jgi:hypothetical protein
VLASPLIYSGQLSREDYELGLAHPSGNSELRYIYLCSSLILLYPDFKISHIARFQGMLGLILALALILFLARLCIAVGQENLNVQLM